ncbi:MAG: hypothetical protein ACREUK_12985, partial [Burkholderiales bacterium]
MSTPGNPYYDQLRLLVQLLSEPDVLAQEIADDLQTALEQFAAIAAELKRSFESCPPRRTARRRRAPAAALLR